MLCYELLTGSSPFSVDGEGNAQTDISRQILKKNPPMPESIQPDANDFITKLLNKNPIERLGSGPTGAEEIKSHAFFTGVDWERLARKDTPAPFKPKIRHPLDTSNFSEEFTNLSVVEPPLEAPPNHKRLFRGKWLLDNW